MIQEGQGKKGNKGNLCHIFTIYYYSKYKIYTHYTCSDFFFKLRKYVILFTDVFCGKGDELAANFPEFIKVGMDHDIATPLY